MIKNAFVNITPVDAMKRLSYKRDNTFIVTDFDEYGLVNGYEIVGKDKENPVIEVSYTPINKAKIVDVFKDGNLLEESRLSSNIRKVSLFNIRRVLAAHDPEIFKEAARRSNIPSDQLMTLYVLFPMWLEKSGFAKHGFIESVVVNADIEMAKKIFSAYVDDMVPGPKCI